MLRAANRPWSEVAAVVGVNETTAQAWRTRLAGWAELMLWARLMVYDDKVVSEAIAAQREILKAPLEMPGVAAAKAAIARDVLINARLLRPRESVIAGNTNSRPRNA